MSTLSTIESAVGTAATSGLSGGIVAALEAGFKAIEAALGLVNAHLALNNTPQMQQNARAIQDHLAALQVTRDLVSGNIAQLNKDVS